MGGYLIEKKTKEFAKCLAQEMFAVNQEIWTVQWHYVLMSVYTGISSKLIQMYFVTGEWLKW